jgi:hypothetical protein
MLTFVGFMFQAAMFWAITAVIVRNHRIHWLNFLLWYVLAIISGIIVAIVLGTIVGTENAIPIGLIRVAVICGILYFGLRQLDIGGAKEKFTILGLFYTVSFGIDMILEASW